MQITCKTFKVSLCSSSLKRCCHRWGLLRIWQVHYPVQAILTSNHARLQFKTISQLKTTQIVLLPSIARSASFTLPMRWHSAAVLPQKLAEMSASSGVKSQTDLDDQTASATVRWLLRKGLNSRISGEKPTTAQKNF